MANPYPASFIDQNNEGRLVGEVNFTDPANQPGGGSSSNEQFNNGAGDLLSSGDNLTFVHSADSALLDLTDPTIPVLLADGTYALTAWLTPDSAHAGKLFGMRVGFNGSLTGGNQNLFQSAPLDSSGDVFPQITLSQAGWKATAGDSLFIQVKNDIGAPETFYMAAYLLKLA